MIESKILKEIIIKQKEHLKKELGINRDVNLKPLKNFATIISGIRRCGKSTFLRQVLKDKKSINYIHFEDIRLSSFEKEDFSKLDKIFNELNNSKIYFLDEIQNVGGWEIYVRSLLEENKEIYITGSNATMLSKELGTRLTGRYIRKEIYPFNFKEFCMAKKLSLNKNSFDLYLKKGGMPEYVLQDDNRILEILLDDLIFRDILSRSNISDSKLVKNIVNYLLSHSGKLVSASKLKNLFNVGSVSTVSLILNSLEDAYLIFQVPMFDFSLKKQIRNPKKIYCIDNGLINELSFQISQNKGRLLENFVFIELKRKNNEIYYHNKNNECDFVIKKGNNVVQAIQVCYELNEDNRKREYAGILDALKEHNLKEGLILTFEEEDELIIENKKIIIKPVWKWVLEE